MKLFKKTEKNIQLDFEERRFNKGTISQHVLGLWKENRHRDSNPEPSCDAIVASLLRQSKFHFRSQRSPQISLKQ